MSRRRVVILGSTGSIGRSALQVIAEHADRFEVVGLAAGKNWQLLAEQALTSGVQHVAIGDTGFAPQLRERLPAATRLWSGAAGLVEFVRETDADFVLAGIVGAAGLPATLAALQRGKIVGLANKESLVVAGPLVMSLVERGHGKLIPVDSEHSAIFQAMHAGHGGDVSRIQLTASGGPFRTWAKERIASATVEEALNHPVWTMGPKITIDSATMMNKALEIIEAHYLFGLPAEKIEVLIHPESIVHSMVEFCDGSVIAQLGTPDMCTPIQYALSYPDRLRAVAARLDWRTARTLRFEPPDVERFPALRLAYAVCHAGGSAGAVLNAANEAAVELFRSGRIPFGRIVALCEEVLSKHEVRQNPSLEELLACDEWARREASECIT